MNYIKLCFADALKSEQIAISNFSPASVKMEVDLEEEESKESVEEKVQEINLDENKLKIEEGEEEFKGFPVLADEIQNLDLVKNLSQKEETELQEMEVFANERDENSFSSHGKRKRRDIEESDLSSHCSSPALSVASQLSVMSFTKRSRTGSPASKGFVLITIY